MRVVGLTGEGEAALQEIMKTVVTPVQLVRAAGIWESMMPLADVIPKKCRALWFGIWTWVLWCAILHSSHPVGC